MSTHSPQYLEILVVRFHQDIVHFIHIQYQEGLLWLNLFLGNKMNHENVTKQIENVTDQIDALAEDLQVTKDTLLQKLEVNINTFNTLSIMRSGYFIDIHKILVSKPSRIQF